MSYFSGNSTESASSNKRSDEESSESDEEGESSKKRKSRRQPSDLSEGSERNSHRKSISKKVFNSETSLDDLEETKDLLEGLEDDFMTEEEISKLPKKVLLTFSCFFREVDYFYFFFFTKKKEADRIRKEIAAAKLNALRKRLEELKEKKRLEEETKKKMESEKELEEIRRKNQM
jgi:hypothetical protein